MVKDERLPTRFDLGHFYGKLRVVSPTFGVAEHRPLGSVERPPDDQSL